jgi:hypothetical protein
MHPTSPTGRSQSQCEYPRHGRTDPSTRVGDPERERAATQLGQAFSQGYLSMAEYDTRLQHAFQSDTAAALDDLVRDLPIRRIIRNDPRRRARRIAAARRGVTIHFAAYLAMSLAVVGIWWAVALAVAAPYFWPIWPILGGGIGVLAHAVPVHRYARRAAH